MTIDPISFALGMAFALGAGLVVLVVGVKVVKRPDDKHKNPMTLQFLVTVAMPAMPPADRVEIIREEIQKHAWACVDFYGHVRPDQVNVILPLASEVKGVA